MSQRSRFTYKQLHALRSYSTSTPLRVIAHIDLDAFYAQCETVRLGLSQDQPLGVQQWDGLIAINYAARKFGITRHANIQEAKKACPELICQHVATWREGDENWAYHDDAAKHIGTHKVSLDPYREQSKRIMAVVKDALPAVRIEKAGIDESFLDLSSQVYGILSAYPELSLPPPYNDPSEHLPLPSSVLDWDTDHLVDAEEYDPDWDDVAMLLGSQLVRKVRRAIFEKLSYTSSAGIAQNKMLAKLGSAYRKPNQQTVVRNRAVQGFLSGFDFTKIRNLGGKLGETVEREFKTSSVEGLLAFGLDDLRKRLGDESAGWLYNTVRGIDRSEVNERTQIKSMLSAKSFRPSINTVEQAKRWLVIFVNDIYGRCVSEGVIENRRRPRTLHLHHRQGGTTRSKSAPLQGKAITKETLLKTAEGLLQQILAEGNAWPCANLMLSAGGFETLDTSTKISAFLVPEIEGLGSMVKGPKEPEEPASKKRKAEDIGDFLETLQESTADTFYCEQCRKEIPDEEATHADWHFARALAQEDRDRVKPKSGIKSAKHASGQTKLTFGR